MDKDKELARLLAFIEDQAYITYEQLIWLCRLWILRKWFVLKKQK
nr:MAG TPA: hypothetical protein [Caudoviricetes sp.]